MARKTKEIEIDLGIGRETAEKSPEGRAYAGLGNDAMLDDDSTSIIAVARGACAALPVPAPSANLITVSSQFGVTTEDLGELARIGADSINRAMFEITRAGLAFLRAQELLSLGNFGVGESSVSERSDTGGFSAWISEHGLARQRVYEAMRIAKFVTHLPQDQLEDVLALGKVKVMLLASLPQEVIDQAAESGSDLIEKADLMTVAELKEEIQTLRRREKNYEAEIERAQSMVKRLNEAKKRTTEFLLRTEEIREECMALQLGAELNLNGLQKQFEEVNAEDPSLPEWRLQMEQIWVTAHVVAARALDLVERMKDSVRDGEMPERVMGQHILTPEEAQRWILDYPMIENRHAADAAARQEKRDAAKPKGPGRPKGSQNKASTGE
ncbi:hypothetical protein ACLSSQ_11690 [Azospira sp. APE16]|uniref:hypothetical protein n=1 Tax=Azospira sp. APE16 TaxID=3394231 RepID=UPI003A4D2F59